MKIEMNMSCSTRWKGKLGRGLNDEKRKVKRKKR
jgi:hypothetical protein